MSYDYNQYASDDNNQNSGSSSGSSSSSNGNDDLNLTMVPHATIEGDLTKVFGNGNQWGQSLGISFENVELVDGCLYYDPDKDKHKVFPWKDVVGISPDEADGDYSAFEPNQFLVKNYGGTEKRYELVESVIPDEEDPVEIGDAIMWYGGSQEHGPKASSKVLAQILTSLGRDMLIDEENANGDYVQNWLRDISATNVCRNDLQGRRFAFFEVKKESNQSDHKYHHPIVIDAQTGAQVTVQNATEEDTQGTLDGDSDDESDTDEAADDGIPNAGGDESGGVPEPIEDFTSTCDSLGFTDRERASALLNDLVEDSGNDLTAEMVDNHGGEDTVLDMVDA